MKRENNEVHEGAAQHSQLARPRLASCWRELLSLSRCRYRNFRYCQYRQRDKSVIFKPLILLAFTMPALPVENSNEPLSLRFAKAPRRFAA
jgi:hypothetical protein